MKKHKRFCMLALVLALSLTLTGCGSGGSGGSGASGSSGKAETYKIAVALALTGGSAEQGTQIRNAVLLAINDLNDAGGVDGKMVELVEFDDQADPKNAATVANAIAADDGVLAVVGHVNSSCTLAGAAIYEDSGIPMITCSSSSPKITDAGDYIFRIWNSDAYTAKVHTQILIDKGYQRVGMIYENNDYGLGAYNVAVESFGEAGVEIAVAESYLLGETKDFTTILTKMKDAGVEAIFAVADETELPMIMNQAHSIAYDPFVTSTGSYSTTVLTLGGEDVEGLYGATFFDPAALPEEVDAYYNRYMKAYNVDATNAPACSGFIAGSVLMDALKNGCTSRDEIRDYLDGLTFDSMLGTLTFDENGDVEIPMQRIMIQNNTFVGVDQ